MTITVIPATMKWLQVSSETALFGDKEFVHMLYGY